MDRQNVEMLFPAIARYVRGYGHIEIGDQEMFGFVARALDYGGMVFEDNRPDTLAEAMAALEKGLRKWFEEQGEDWNDDVVGCLPARQDEMRLGSHIGGLT